MGKLIACLEIRCADLQKSPCGRHQDSDREQNSNPQFDAGGSLNPADVKRTEGIEGWETDGSIDGYLEGVSWRSLNSYGSELLE